MNSVFLYVHYGVTYKMFDFGIVLYIIGLFCSEHIPTKNYRKTFLYINIYTNLFISTIWTNIPAHQWTLFLSLFFCIQKILYPEKFAMVYTIIKNIFFSSVFVSMYSKNCLYAFTYLYITFQYTL